MKSWLFSWADIASVVSAVVIRSMTKSTRSHVSSLFCIDLSFLGSERASKQACWADGRADPPTGDRQTSERVSWQAKFSADYHGNDVDNHDDDWIVRLALFLGRPSRVATLTGNEVSHHQRQTTERQKRAVHEFVIVSVGV